MDFYDLTGLHLTNLSSSNKRSLASGSTIKKFALCNHTEDRLDLGKARSRRFRFESKMLFRCLVTARSGGAPQRRRWLLETVGGGGLIGEELKLR